MNALQQYIDLYEAQRTTICANAPEALNIHREQALDTLKALPRLPEKGDEGFEQCSVNDMFAPDFGINLTRVPFAVDPRTAFGCDVPAVSRMSAMLVGDSYVPVPGLEEMLPEGVEMMSLAKAAEKYPDLAAQQIAPAQNPLVALNTLFAQDGVFIRIHAGVVLDKPLQILSVFNTAMPTMAVRRIKIFVDDNAHGSVLLCDHPRVKDVAYLNSRVVEISVGRNANFSLYDLEEATLSTARASVTASQQQADSTLHITSLFLNGGVTRNETYPEHLGQNCATHLGGIVIGGASQVIDNYVALTHSMPRCTSSQIFKYALFNSARGAFEGRVTVQEQATYTEAHQTNRNLLASPGALMHSQPQLIINCDEVKASHGSATGQLDENALFYMRSRGIPEAEARMMLINAFMSDVLDTIQHESLRERMRAIVDRRLRGCETTCDSCSAMR